MTNPTPGKALDDSLAALRADIKADVKAEMTAAKNEILAAINGGIDSLRADLNREFAKHKIPVKLATAKRTA